MCNFIVGEDLKVDCLSCSHFRSYKDIYEDDFEPWEFGLCDEVVSEMVGDDMVCDLFKKR